MCAHNFKKKGKPYHLGHHQFFWNIGHAPIEAPLSTPNFAKEKQLHSPRIHLFGLYTWELNFGQTIWDKYEVLLGVLGVSWGMDLGTPWELENPLGTWWEHIENKAEKQNIPLPHPLHPKKKKLDQISLSKTVCHHFSTGLIPLPKSWGTYREKGI